MGKGQGLDDGQMHGDSVGKLQDNERHVAGVTDLTRAAVRPCEWDRSMTRA